jgi:hypothetical protein
MEHVMAAQERTTSTARKSLLAGGILSSLLYPATDIVAGSFYPGYSFVDQAVSELFAIGAPTSRLVVPLFTVCSALLAACALGVWLSSGGKRALRILAWMMAGNAVNSVVLWNFFPMHMRGAEPTVTDTMHALLAINPFVLASMVVGAVAFGNRFRFYSIGTILLALVLAAFGFSTASRVFTNEPTPWLGLTERASQYAFHLWQAVLAIALLPAPRVPSARFLGTSTLG